MRALIYCEWDAREWQTAGRADLRPGQAPYGVEHLAGAGVELSYWQPAGLISTGPLQKARIALEYGHGTPFVRALSLARSQPRPDVAIAMLEEQGYLHALLKAAGVPPWRDVPLVLMSCWLAERAKVAHPAVLRVMRRIAQAADLIVIWSTNQREIYEGLLGVHPDRLYFVPFGVETDFYRPLRSQGTGGYVLSAGRDLGRDYRTLFEAAEYVDRPVKVVCRPSWLQGLQPGPNVEILGEVPHREYRALLWGADVVALACHPETVYPTGQTVLLNAMSIGRPTVITRTEPLSDYTRHLENTFLVPANDPHALAEGINEVLASPELASRLVDAALQDVRTSFNAEVMWQSIAERLRALRPSG